MHTHACLGAIFFLLTEVMQKSFFCLSSSFPFLPRHPREGWLLLAYSLCVCECMCVHCMYVCVSWLFHFLQLYVHNESKFSHVGKINSASIHLLKPEPVVKGSLDVRFPVLDSRETE